MLKKITTLQELSTFVPELCRMHDEFAGKWNKESDQQEFLSELVSNFSGKSQFYGSLDAQGALEYMAIIYDCGEICQFRVFYVNKHYHHLTKEIITELRAIQRERGYKKCFFTTMRITRSYDRWIRKLGAEPVEVTYNINLT